MAELSLEPVQEVIQARRLLHGGGVGAPRLNAQQQREGAALNRAAMVSLGAALEAYVEDVFLSCARVQYSDFTEDQYKKVSNLLPVPRTTSPNKIRDSFFVLGVVDIFDGMSWRNCTNATVVNKLDKINQIRNRCAHGNRITFNGTPISLTLPMVQGFLQYAYQFGNRFEQHALEYF